MYITHTQWLYLGKKIHPCNTHQNLMISTQKHPTTLGHFFPKQFFVSVTTPQPLFCCHQKIIKHYLKLLCGEHSQNGGPKHHLILGPLNWECPQPMAFSYTPET
jgi:hypothetical protein